MVKVYAYSFNTSNTSSPQKYTRRKKKIQIFLDFHVYMRPSKSSAFARVLAIASVSDEGFRVVVSQGLTSVFCLDVRGPRWLAVRQLVRSSLWLDLLRRTSSRQMNDSTGTLRIAARLCFWLRRWVPGKIVKMVFSGIHVYQFRFCFVFLWLWITIISNHLQAHTLRRLCWSPDLQTTTHLSNCDCLTLGRKNHQATSEKNSLLQNSQRSWALFRFGLLCLFWT